jgi:hypothetical protein
VVFQYFTEFYSIFRKLSEIKRIFEATGGCNATRHLSSHYGFESIRLKTTKMSEDGERVTKPFKFVTGKLAIGYL